MEPPTSSAAAEDEHTAQLWRDLVDNSVECELCNEPYADDEDGDHLPRLLGCGHTFCQVHYTFCAFMLLVRGLVLPRMRNLTVTRVRNPIFTIAH